MSFCLYLFHQRQIVGTVFPVQRLYQLPEVLHYPARIVIGKDTRRSSYMFEYSLVAGLTASGADAYLLHVTTTPSVAYIARVDDFDCGIMISASHNPYYDNGIKLIDCYGEKMPEEILLLVEDYIDGKLHGLSEQPRYLLLQGCQGRSGLRQR